MGKILDLNEHLSILSVNQVSKICQPLTDAFNVTHFRYLKLYKDGSRVLLSNHPDYIRYAYEVGRYKDLWFDGEFPEFLKQDWYSCEASRLLDEREEEFEVEWEINNWLGINHGLTFIQPYDDYYDVFSFDSNTADIYSADKSLLYRFMLYFKEQANQLIKNAESEKIILPIKSVLTESINSEKQEQILQFLDSTKVNRHYLNGKYAEIYLTSKEVAYAKLLIQGKNAQEIAAIESCSPLTVKRYIEKIKLKLNCSKQAQIVQIMMKSGLATLPPDY